MCLPATRRQASHPQHSRMSASCSSPLAAKVAAMAARRCGAVARRRGLGAATGAPAPAPAPTPSGGGVEERGEWAACVRRRRTEAPGDSAPCALFGAGGDEGRGASAGVSSIRLTSSSAACTSCQACHGKAGGAEVGLS